MNKTTKFALSVLALTLLGSSANAQVFYLSPNNATAAAGSKWKVTLTSLGINTWKVSINAAPVSPLIPATAVPNFDPNNVSITFRDSGGFVVATTSATQAGVDKLVDGTGGPTSWTVNGANNSFQGGFNSSLNKLDNTLNNTFSVILQRANTTAKTLQIGVNAESGARWFGSGTLAPEANAVSMLLPALLPVGLMLRRRNRLAKKTI